MKRHISLLIAIILLLSFNFTVFAASDKIPQTDKNELLMTAETSYEANDYSEYLIRNKSIGDSSEDICIEINDDIKNDKSINFNVEIPKDGKYTVGMLYKPTDSGTQELDFGLKIDGEYPYGFAQKLSVPRMWTDAEEKNRTDELGNEFSAEQVEFNDYCLSTVTDKTLKNGYRPFVFLTKGTHNIEIVYCHSEFSIKSFVLGKTSEPQAYKKPGNKNKFYSGNPIAIEGEKAYIKSSNFLIGKSDTSSVMVTPNDASRNLVNYIGGGNWKTIGDKIVWKTPKLKEGYYSIGFSYRQNSVIGSKVYRELTIDGEVPFLEAQTVEFAYNDNWQQSVFSDDKKNPYMIFLSEGEHEIALTVAPGDISLVRNALTKAVAELGNLYVDITMITGETVDVYRDYNLFSQVPDMENRLKDIVGVLNEAADNLLRITGEKSGSNYSVIKNMVEIANQMLQNKFEAHTYVKSYYSNYCSVSSVLQELRNMPLDLDKIVLFASGEKSPFGKTEFGKQFIFSVKRLLITYTRDYNGISSSNSKNSITVWVNWGRDQAQVLSSLVERSFVTKTKIGVNLQLVNASVVQAVLSGNGPDCILQHTRSEPVNLAMRGALYDLSQFKDCKTVLKRFQKGAEIPYLYNGGLYALPDTQTFFMMFYRKDILEEYNIQVPNTWEDFSKASKILMRNNMSLYLPNTAATNAAQINAGVGSVNIFPSLLLQNNIELFTDDGKSTNLLSPEAMKVFGEWTDYYTKQKFPISLDFYNRFRIGITPIGISSYTLYTTLKVAAPEIEGLWGMTYIPGTSKPDGSISYASSGGGTGCAILKETKNPDGAWEFLKWWTSADTQYAYSNDIESLLGPVGRVALSNIDAIKKLSWDDGILDSILNSWKQVEEIPEYPGSYYITRSIYQSFWNVVSSNKNKKDMLMKYGKEANDEISRKWKQYADRKVG